MTQVTIQPDGTITDLEGTPFEDQETVNWHLIYAIPKFEVGKNYTVSLPEYEKVRQIRIKNRDANDWWDFNPGTMNYPHQYVDYRTVLRLVPIRTTIFQI